VNTSKTEVIFFGGKNKLNTCKNTPPIQFQNQTLEVKECVKYLGVTFEENMSWSKQAKNVRNKAYGSLARIRRVKKYIDEATISLLVNALVLPHINYCVSSWGNLNLSDIRRIDFLFNSINKVSATNRNFKNIVNINQAIMIFKGLNHLCPSYVSDRLVLTKNHHRHNTRFAAANSLVIQHASNKHMKRTFLCHATSIWNSLPLKLKTTDSLLSFKTMAKKHFFD